MEEGKEGRKGWENSGRYRQADRQAKRAKCKTISLQRQAIQSHWSLELTPN